MPVKNALLVSLLLLAASTGSAQQQQQRPEAEFEEEIRVTEVFLDVLVLEDDEPVVGLTADDFRVTEDGEPIELTSVELYSTRYGGPESAAIPAGVVPASRYFVLFFEDQRRNLTAGANLLRRQLQAGQEARRWVATDLGGSDWVAVVGFTSHLELYLDFSQDRDAVVRAIEDAARGKPGLQDWPGRLQSTDPSAPSLLANLESARSLARRTADIHDALRIVAEGLGNIVGRKNLLLFSIGFGRLDPQTGFAIPDRLEYPALEDALNTNNVAVYPVDLTPVGFEHAQRDFLDRIAFDTGGEYRQNAINFSIVLDQIERQNNAYYLLSYRSEHPRDESGYQEVKVEVPGRRVKVLARQGYHFGEPRRD